MTLRYTPFEDRTPDLPSACTVFASWIQPVVVSLSLPLLVFSCGGGASSPSLPDSTPPSAMPPTSLPPTQTSASFKNSTLSARLNSEHRISAVTSDADRIAAGVAAGDYDGDGYIDLYIVGGDDETPDQLFRNVGNGDMRFEDSSELAGIDVSGRRGSGPMFVDVNGDTHVDLFVGCVDGNPPMLWMNGADGTFTEQSDVSGLTQMTRKHTFSASFGDYDLDGDLDAAFSHWDWQEGVTPTYAIDQTQTLWSNDGTGRFVDVSIPSALSAAIGADGTDYTFTPNFADINNDRYPDLLMASDFKTSQVFINNQDGTFSDVTDPVISDENGMGAAIADYDNDGDLDWFVTAIAADTVDPSNGFNGNRLYRNEGNGSFVDVTDDANVRVGGWGWAACFADFDNDSNIDLFHVNGWYDDRFDTLPARLFMADGLGAFREQAIESGITTDRQGRGIVCADFDRDGDIDLFIANNRNFAELYENTSDNSHHWLTVQLSGTTGNTQGVGARIYATTDNKTQMREIRIGSNFVSQHVAEAHFGLGETSRIDTIRVDWPDGHTTTLSDIQANQVLVIEP